MKTLTTLTLTAALCLLGGCGNGTRTDATGDAAPPPEAQTGDSDNPFEFLAFWKWFEDDEPPAPQPANESAAASAPSAQPMRESYDREPFTYVEVKKEKPWTDYFLPWKWFSDEEETEAEVAEFDDYEGEPVADDERGPLDFMMFWKSDDRDGKPKPLTESDVLGDMSPELVTRAETKPETRIRRAKLLDVNTRGIWDDINHIMLFDRPSRLSPYPSP